MNRVINCSILKLFPELFKRILFEPAANVLTPVITRAPLCVMSPPAVMDNVPPNVYAGKVIPLLTKFKERLVGVVLKTGSAGVDAALTRETVVKLPVLSKVGVAVKLFPVLSN